ncbi:hypothetical protein L7F22_053093 [Adiantum nelumboides]|nr:hypothetical protein [Adiantum nelumboides]
MADRRDVIEEVSSSQGRQTHEVNPRFMALLQPIGTQKQRPELIKAQAQKDVYNAVLSAYKDSLQMYKPGSTLGDIHRVSNDKLVRATRGLGIVKKRDDYLKVNPTAVGRYLGLDCLDCKLIHEDRKLVPGVVNCLPAFYKDFFQLYSLC